MKLNFRSQTWWTFVCLESLSFSPEVSLQLQSMCIRTTYHVRVKKKELNEIAGKVNLLAKWILWFLKRDNGESLVEIVCVEARMVGLKTCWMFSGLPSGLIVFENNFWVAVERRISLYFAMLRLLRKLKTS